jgi:hypothetical protein
MRQVITFILMVTSFGLNAQRGSYTEDLEALRSIIQKTPSFRTQIKGDKLRQYDSLYNQLGSDTVHDQNSYKYFYHLARLIFPVRDNHLGFYQLPDFDNFKSKSSIDSFVLTKEFLDYPSVIINLDSLKRQLSKKPPDSIEGIYQYDKYYTIGLYKNERSEYLGVVLDSEINLWRKGQVAIHLFETAPNIYKAIYGHPLTKNFIYQPIEKYLNRSLVNSYFYGSYSQGIYSKEMQTVDHVNLPKDGSRFEFKDVDNKDFQYLLIKTFQADTKTSQASQRFYDSIKNLVKAANLILDLRNNEGGAEKEMAKYFQFLKGYVERGHLYVLINNGTMSQAEIFTIKLKKLKNVTTLGQTTRGMLTYRSNYGKRERLPSARFEVYPTDMLSGQLAYLEYEDYGIKPDVELGNERDWVMQILEVKSRDHQGLN